MAQEWIKASLALKYVALGGYDLPARYKICERAHHGLIPAKAERIIWNGQEERDKLIGKRFWWAEGQEALEQDWQAGDFTTWINQKDEVKAFGVSFDFAALSELVPADKQAEAMRTIYPHDEEIRAAVRKALTLDVIPVIVARRIQYASFRVLGTCGVIMHETYNQRLANADAAIAEQAKHKDLLGYHDIRTGNAPDARLTRFFADQLPGLLDRSRASLDQYRDLLEAYTSRDIPYAEFAARVRRRRNRQNEDNDWPGEGELDPENY